VGLLGEERRFRRQRIEELDGEGVEIDGNDQPGSSYRQQARVTAVHLELGHVRRP